MADVTIKYKGQSIATMDASGSKTLGTQGKYCEGDIAVEYAKPAGPTGTKSITITENGTTTEDVAAYANAEITVDVQGGGGSSYSDMVSAFIKKEISGDIVLDSSVKGLPHTYFMSEQPITSFRCDGIGGLPGYAFANCKSLVSIHLPNLTTLYATHCFDGCSALTMACFPKLGTGKIQYTYTATFYNCSSLQSADLGMLGDTSRGRGLNNQDFYGCTNLKTLILRKNDAICALCSISCFQNSSIASGGNGCTIYIPKALYDHLGDGSSLDYKAATNWSTVDGYETITWAQIEGSIYETQYADGTPIT